MSSTSTFISASCLRSWLLGDLELRKVKFVLRVAEGLVGEFTMFVVGNVLERSLF